MTRNPRSGSGARRGSCPRCRRPVLQQLVGQRAALNVTADTQQMTAAAAHPLRTRDRLDWCVRETRDGLDLRWTYGRHAAAGCPHPHVLDHVCTAPAQPHRPARRTPRPVPAGQLTL